MRWIIALCLTALPAFADVQSGDKVIECYCTDSQGARVDLGQTICLFVDGRSFTARCEMSLNNPTWRDTGQGCLSSSSKINMLQSFDPAQPHLPITLPSSI